MKLALVAMLAVGGCDSLFNIHRIEITTASSPDAPVSFLDAAGDAANCGMHDEDGDGAFDKCDTCPTISNAHDGDADGDGVGDMCDPDPARANTIDAFYSFQNGVGVNGTGDSYPNDTLRLNDGGRVDTVKTFTTPEVIDVTISNLNAGVGTEIVVNPGGTSTVTCELSALCSSTPTCLMLTSSSGEAATANLLFTPSEVTSLVLYRVGMGPVQCSVNDLRAENTVMLPTATMPSGKIELVSLGGATTYTNAIVYNVQ